jgi:hypothetical protein
MLAKAGTKVVGLIENYFENMVGRQGRLKMTLLFV